MITWYGSRQKIEELFWVPTTFCIYTLGFASTIICKEKDLQKIEKTGLVNSLTTNNLLDDWKITGIEVPDSKIKDLKDAVLKYPPNTILEKILDIYHYATIQKEAEEYSKPNPFDSRDSQDTWNIFDNFTGQISDQEDYDSYWWQRGEKPSGE